MSTLSQRQLSWLGINQMREIEIKKKTVYETDLAIPEGSTWLGMGLWCAVNLEKKCDLIFENNIAQFLTKEDAEKFEKVYGV